MTSAVRAFWFFGNKLRDGRPIPADGDWLEHTGPITACISGLHASRCPFDALTYAPGSNLALVELDGQIGEHGNPVDKLVASRRRIIARIDATDLLRQFARQCALAVIDKWDAPAIVREYLETGDPRLRAAAYSTAFYAASVASEASAACSAAYSAACSAAACPAAACSAADYAAHYADSAADYAARSAAQREAFRSLVFLAFRLGAIA